MRASIVAVILGIVPVLTSCTSSEPQVAKLPPPEVSVSQPVIEQVQESLEFTGRTAAIDSVEVRARVAGYITKVAFTAGALVKQGDLLFEIDPREYRAAVLQSEGEVARLQAVQARTESEVGRTQRLRPSGAASERELERAVAEQGSVKGELLTARAKLDKARLDLEFTQVRAPVAGRASRAEVTEGNLVVVGADGGPVLTTVVSVNPMWVYFDVDEQAMLRFRDIQVAQNGRAAPESVASANIPVGIGLVNQTGFPQHGTIDFVDNQVDPSTGTIRVRAVVQNDSALLTPGLFVRVQVPLGAPAPGVLVTDRAIGTDQDRKYVMVVNDANVVEYRPVKLGPRMGDLRVVTEGVAAGDWVVVNGLQRVRPGVTVTPQKVAMRTAPAAGAS